MIEYRISIRRYNVPPNSPAFVRSVRWEGPAYVKGRYSQRITVVWTLRPRRLSQGGTDA